jgi:hypothetical protein
MGMESTIKTSCDTCDKDLSPIKTGYPNKYILRVTTEDIARSDGMGIFAVAIYPPIDSDLYFCGLKCMKAYGDKK